MNYQNIKYGRASEWQRGQVFQVVNFSTAEIEENGGSVLGTVASFGDVNNVKTVIAKLSSTQLSSMTVKINSGQTITITAGNLFGSYSNATAFDADDIQIDDYSKFEFVKIFSTQLSTAEITAYENGTMWDYDKDCVFWMDGKLDRYDPTNVRHLDASKAGNHLTFGDGATSTTYPTKLTERPGGYSFDGGDSFRKTIVAGDGLDFTSEATYAIVFNTTNPTTRQGLIGKSKGSAGADVSFHLEIALSAANKLSVKIPGSSLICDGSVTNGINQACVAVNSSETRMLLNDVYSESLGATMLSCTGYNFEIGRYPNYAGVHYNGSVLAAAVFNAALNQTQMLDICIRMTEDRRA